MKKKAKRIFSGDGSERFWDAIARSRDKSLLYDYGCKAQELEQKLAVARAETKKLRRQVEKK